MNIEKMKAFAQAQRESEESTEIRPAPKPAEPEYQPEAIYIPIEDDDPSEMPDDGFAAVSIEEEPELPETETVEEIIAKCFPEDKSYNIELDRLCFHCVLRFSRTAATCRNSARQLREWA